MSSALPHVLPMAREESRLAALARLGLLDTPADPAFDRLTRMLAVLMDVPVAVISLVDRDRQWFKSVVGLDIRETPRDQAFCAHALRGPEMLVVPDAAQDPRFADNPLVTSGPGIRFYAGVPLVLPDGHVLGTLCAIDRKARQISTAERWLLTELAATVVSLIDLHCNRTQLERQAGTDLLTQLPARTAFLDTMLARLSEPARAGTPQALLLLDLDGLRAINALLGHNSGDTVLREAAAALVLAAPAGAALGRVGGDRFAMMLDAPHPDSAAAQAETCRQGVAIAIADAGWTVGVSLGAALFAAPPSDMEYALAQAEAALLVAKAEGGSRTELLQIGHAPRHAPDATVSASPLVSSAA